MGLCEQVYFDPALVDIIDGAFHMWSELKTKTLKLLPKWIIGSSAEQAADKGPEEKTAKRDLEGAVAEGGETVEPILDAFGAYSTCAMFTVYNVRLGVVWGRSDRGRREMPRAGLRFVDLDRFSGRGPDDEAL